MRRIAYPAIAASVFTLLAACAPSGEYDVGSRNDSVAINGPNVSDGRYQDPEGSVVPDGMNQKILDDARDKANAAR